MLVCESYMAKPDVGVCESNVQLSKRLTELRKEGQWIEALAVFESCRV